MTSSLSLSLIGRDASTIYRDCSSKQVFEGSRHLTTIDGRRRFVEGPPGPTPRLTDARYDGPGEAGQAAIDEARLDHHGRLLVVACWLVVTTSVVRHTVATGRRLVALNRHAISARMTGRPRRNRAPLISPRGIEDLG